MREIVSTQVRVLKGGVHKYWVQPFWQQALNLMGASDHMIELTGVAMKEEEYTSVIPDPLLLASYRLRKLELMCYFRCHSQALKYAELLESTASSIETMCPLVVTKHCWVGITYLTEARCGKARYYKRKAKRALKRLARLVDAGCIDAKPYYLILKANFAAFEKEDVAPIRMEFDGAIEAAIKSGFQGIAAFAYEQAYHSLRDNHEDERCVQMYWNTAVEYYTSWGAFGKIDQMKQLQRHRADPIAANSQLPSVVEVDVTD